MRIHFFPKGDITVPSTKYRVIYLAEKLETLGVDVSIYSPLGPGGLVHSKSLKGMVLESTNFIKAIWDLFSYRRGDVIFSQRSIYLLGRSLAILGMGKLTNRMIFDWDDPTFLHTPRRTQWFLSNSRFNLCGNHFLKMYSEYFNDSSFWFPTALPLDKYQCPDRDYSSQSLTIGWMGNADAHRENLIGWFDIAREIGDQVDNVKLILVGTKATPEIVDRYRGIENLETEFIDWIPAEDYMDSITEIMAKFDVGVMPLEETIFNFGKSGLKIVEYMSQKVVPVASSVGENSKIITHGENGFLADTSEDWIEAIQKLKKEKVRRQLGERARQEVEENYSLKKNAESLIDRIGNLT